MDESQSPVPQSAAPARNHLKRKVDKLVDRARWTMWWEGAWPLLWVPIAIILVFLTVSWLGIWLDTPPLARALGLAFFVAALGLSLWPVLRLGRPSRSRALDRVDRDTGLKHGPARTLDDKLALGDADPGSRALWDLHRKRAEAAIEKFKVLAPRPDMPRHDRFALRAAGMLAAVASAFVAGPEVGSRLAAAFDWKPAKVAAPSFRVDGWVDPPLYTRVPPLMIDLAGGPQKLRAPVKSTVVVRVAGQGEVAITPGAGPHAAAGAREPAHRPARAALHPRGQCRVERAHRDRRRDAPDARGHSRPAARDQLRRRSGGECARHLHADLQGQGRLRHRLGRGRRREGRWLQGQAHPRAGAADHARASDGRRRRGDPHQRRPYQPSLGRRPGQAHASRQGRGDP